MMCNIDLKRYVTLKLALLVHLHVEYGPVKKGAVGDKGPFIIYGDDLIGKSKVPFSFFPNTCVKIVPGFGGPSRFVPNFSKPV